MCGSGNLVPWKENSFVVLAEICAAMFDINLEIHWNQFDMLSTCGRSRSAM